MASRLEQAKQIAAESNLTIAEALAVIALDPVTAAAMGSVPPPAVPADADLDAMDAQMANDTGTISDLDPDTVAAINALDDDEDETEGVMLPDPDGENEDADTSQLIQGIKTLLADQFTVYYRAHSAHWNVKGPSFGAYHELFGEVADDLYGAIDGIAEELLKLDDSAPCCFSELFENSSIIAHEHDVNDPAQLCAELVGMLEALLETLTTVFDYADDADEQGVANLVADRIDMTRKWRWQIRASIS